MKFLSSFVRSIGVLILISLTVIFIIMGRIMRDMTPDDPYYKVAAYIASFENRFYDYRIKTHLRLEVSCDVTLLENALASQKVKDISEILKILKEEKKPNYLKECDKYQQKELLLGEYLNLVNSSQLKNQFAEYFKKTDKEKHLEITHQVKKSKPKENIRYISDDIILIKVDDESLAKINSWPVPRENWTNLLDKLTLFNTKVVAFDVLFPEEVKSCGDVSPDDGFNEAVGRFQSENDRRIIFAYTVQNAQKGDTEFLSEFPVELYGSMVDSQVVDENDSLTPNLIEKHTWPISKLLENEPDLGYLNMHEDTDGVFRHYPLAANITGDNIIVPSLGFRAYMSYTGKSPKLVVRKGGSNSHLEIDNKKIGVNAKGESKIRWIGETNNYRSISLWKVLAADPSNPFYQELLSNKIAFIGSTAVGAHDLRNSPINSKLPGVYAHMNFVDMLLQNNFYKPMEDSIKYSFYFLGISMLILIVVMFFGNAILDLFVMIALVASTYYVDYAYFLEDGYQITLFFINFCIVTTYSYITFLSFYQASSEKKQIKGAFSRYVAPSIVDDMLENPDKLKIGGEKRDITCMFSDVRDFTSISEMLSPTDLAMALNKYMGKMTDIVFETNGTLDKYIGDAIVAFWGAPLDIGDHVNQAVDAAVKQLEALPAINEEFKAKGYPEFKIGLGLNSGDCSVGNMGSDQIFAYTALGDNMNLGARLESLCKYYGAQILVSEYTFKRMDQERFQSRLIDMVIVKGKTEPVGVYEVLYSYHPLMIDQTGLKQFKEAYQLFLDGKFKEAQAIFQHLLENHSHDKACLRMNEACQKWIDNPPKEGEDWRITTMTTKG